MTTKVGNFHEKIVRIFRKNCWIYIFVKVRKLFMGSVIMANVSMGSLIMANVIMGSVIMANVTEPYSVNECAPWNLPMNILFLFSRFTNSLQSPRTDSPTLQENIYLKLF